MTLHQMVARYKVKMILQAIRQCDGNYVRAADQLSCHRNTITRALSGARLDHSKVSSWIREDAVVGSTEPQERAS